MSGEAYCGLCTWLVGEGEGRLVAGSVNGLRVNLVCLMSLPVCVCVCVWVGGWVCMWVCVCVCECVCVCVTIVHVF